MSKFVSKARGYLRRKKAERAAKKCEANSESTNLTKRIGVISKKMVTLKIQLHDVSLAYLKMVQGQLREKIGRKRQRRQPVVERRNLLTLALRMKSTANRVFNRVKAGKILNFPAAAEGSPIKDPNH